MSHSIRHGVTHNVSHTRPDQTRPDQSCSYLSRWFVETPKAKFSLYREAIGLGR